MKKKTKTLLTAVAIPLAVGGVSGFLTRNSMEVFRKLKKPPLAPPGWLFPIVWTILFLAMGTASWIIWESPRTRKRTEALQVYGIQLAVNFFWPLFFFLGKWYKLAFAWLVLLGWLVWVCIQKFYDISRKAAYLLVPYLLWLVYAGYLNLFISLWN